jgi:hypothetical protein
MAVECTMSSGSPSKSKLIVRTNGSTKYFNMRIIIATIAVIFLIHRLTIRQQYQQQYQQQQQQQYQYQYPLSFSTTLPQNVVRKKRSWTIRVSNTSAIRNETTLSTANVTTTTTTTTKSALPIHTSTIVTPSTTTTTATDYTTTHPWEQDKPLSRIDSLYPSPIYQLDSNTTVSIHPLYGLTHRPHQDVIFTMAQKHPLKVICRFIGSLLHTNYTGDIVIGVDANITADTKEYLQSHPSIIPYQIDMTCQLPSNNNNSNSSNKSTTTNCVLLRFYQSLQQTKQPHQWVPDIRPYRNQQRLPFEYYYQWANQYSKTSRILLLDMEDTYIQRNPFESLSQRQWPTTLMAFELPRQSTSNNNQYHSTSNINNTNTTINTTNTTTNNTTTSLPSLCSTSIVGGQPAMMAYFSGMLHVMDKNKKSQKDTISRIHTDLVYHGRFHHKNIMQVEVVMAGMGIVYPLNHMVLINDTMVRNMDGTPSPVVHHYALNDTVLTNYVSQNITNAMLVEWTNEYLVNKIKNAMKGVG